MMFRKRFSVVCGMSLPLLMALLLSSGQAHAYFPLEEGQVSLDRSPVLLSTAMPVELVCEYDEDDNGLDDEIERQIAQAFVPQFRFDVAEEHTGPGEPHAVFNTRLTLDAGGNRIITVRYVFVWDEDGGWVNDSTPGCGDYHKGDTQPMTATVRLVKGADRWYAELTKLAGFTGVWDELGAEVLLFEGPHPLVFPAAGKHHFYPYPDEYTYEHTGPDCTENAYGNGIRRTPEVEHVPHGTWSHMLSVSQARDRGLGEACTQNKTVVRVCVEDPSRLPDPAYVECTEDESLHVTFEAEAWENCTDYPQ